MSLQIAILKVLSSYASRRASVSAIKADLAILCSSGSEWTQKLKQLSSRAPELDIFGQGLVLRDESGWQLTESGAALLRLIEAPRATPITSDARPPI